MDIAAARDMITTAEGVETEQQREMLRALGCSEMQGWLFSPAKPAADIRQLFFAHRKKSAGGLSRAKRASSRPVTAPQEEGDRTLLQLNLISSPPLRQDTLPGSRRPFCKVDGWVPNPRLSRVPSQ